MSHASLRRFVPGAADVQRKRQLQQMTAAQELAAMRTALRVGRGVRGAMPSQSLQASFSALSLYLSGFKLAKVSPDFFWVQENGLPSTDSTVGYLCLDHAKA